jgi:predicted metal-dependent phosphoesterase TrpH
MTKTADLHIHTHYSDSTQSPLEVVKHAQQQGLGCIAITDHDTIEGVQPTQEIAQGLGLEVIAGIEMSSEWQGKDIHVLGYFLDCANPFLLKSIKLMQDARIDRMQKMIEKLKKLGIDNINLEEVCALTQSKSVGRPHLATLLKSKGWVKTLKAAFEKYLDENAPAYVPKYKQSPYEAIELIQKSGGVAVLAHPMLTQVDELIPSFVRGGLKGLEVYYPNCPMTLVHFYEKLAKKHQIAVTGGSDAHGDAKRNTYIGRIKIDYALVEQLKTFAHAN